MIVPALLPLLLAFAGPLSARIAADPTTVTVGDELQIVLEVERQGSGDLPEPAMEQQKLDGFDGCDGHWPSQLTVHRPSG